MKNIIINILLLCFVFTLTSCSNKETDVTGLYQWSLESDEPSGEYKKSIIISKKDNGDLVLDVQDKFQHGDVIDNYLKATITIDSKIKYWEIITAYSDTKLSYCKHEFIFEKNSIKWRYAMEKHYVPDIEFVPEDIESKEYYELGKYDPN